MALSDSNAASIRCYNVGASRLINPFRRSQYKRPHVASNMKTSIIALVVTLLALSGCGNQEMLVPIRNAQPASVDFSGRWRMREDLAEMREQVERAISETDDVDERRILQGMIASNSNRRSRSRNVGGLVHVFLENGQNLRITQTDAGLFIAFDRSVVEEYRFGEARMLSKGGARVQRVSGWEGDAYVIETLDEHGMKLSERYEMATGGDELSREIRLRSKEDLTITVVQTFARES